MSSRARYVVGFPGVGQVVYGREGLESKICTWVEPVSLTDAKRLRKTFAQPGAVIFELVKIKSARRDA